MKRYLIPVAILAALALPGVASAHTPSVVKSCSGLAVNLTQYEGSAPNNRVTVTIDGVATVADFGGSYSHTFPWSQTADHSYTVVIDANRNQGNPTQYDTSFQGTQAHCQEAPTTTVAPTTTTTTTVPVTTTTAPVTTTTDPVVTTTPTTTVAVTEPPLPPTVAPTMPPADPIRPSLSDAQVVLPVTGSRDELLVGAAALVVAGVIVLLISRWRLKP